MRRVFCCSTLIASLLVAVTTFAQHPVTSPSKTLTPEALVGLRHLSELEFSPDGTRLAFVVNEPPKGDKRQSNIWLFVVADGSFHQLTFSEKSESSPKWSPDGKSLAFLSSRDTNQQLYLLSLSGGEAAPLTKGKRDISRFAWSPDGKHIAFLAPDPKTDAEEKKEKDKDDAHLVDLEDKHARLWTFNLADHSELSLTTPNYAVSDLAWLPDGNSIAIVATDQPASDRHTERIFLVEASASPDSRPKLLLAPRGPFGELAVAPSGHTISFVGSRGDGPVPHDLFLLPAGMPAAKNLTAANLDRPVFAHKWLKTGALVLLAADGFTRKLIHYSSDGSREDISTTGTAPSAFAVTSSGAIAFVGETSTDPQELWYAAPGETPRKLPHFNLPFGQFAVRAPEIFKYKSFDGQEIEAALLKPSGYDGNSRLPLIALIHGGPTGAWESSIESWGQLLVARGYLVFYPNIRGSSGYGEKFIESNRADWGGGDFKDVLAGVEGLVSQGIADPDRVGIGGWSYGGYMSEWAITQKAKYPFKAAVSGAGMANLISEFGTEQGPAYDEWFWSVPYEKPEGFLNHSPFLYLKDARTPTLILQGDADRVDPLGQSQELYRGLKRYGVATELVVYPREPHGIHEEKHLIDRLNRIVAWFDKYLK
jgi:dipeptidyl aminopeptidase/acylaminoacyl peptidase